MSASSFRPDSRRPGDALTRRGFVIGASSLGAAAIVAGREAIAQDASPAASPEASVGAPSASPVAGGGPSLFDSDEHRMVMTFNVAHASDLEAWEERKHVVLQILQQNRPLLVGTQETLKVQLDFFEENLPDYDYVGISRQGNTEDEYNAILFDTTRATVEESGTFWLSENPSEPGSMLPGEGHPRIATWGRFAIAGHPDPVYMVNTHLSFEEGAVERQLEILLEGIAPIMESGAEVLLTADFNRPRHTHVWQAFQAAGFHDAWQVAETHAGPPTTFHGWEGLEAQGGFEQDVVADDADYRIDWVLHHPGSTSPISRPLVVNVVTDHDGDIYPSDHFPVALMSTGTPDFAVDGLTVTPAAVVAHDQLTAEANVTNNGETGTAEVTLYVDRVPVATQWPVLQAGESRAVTFDHRLYAPGEHEVSIQLLAPMVVTVEGVPAKPVFLGLEAEPYINPGDVIPLVARVQNQGSFEATTDVDFYVDDALVDTAAVTIPPGETREVGFVHGFEESGAYAVTVGSIAMEISVMEPLGAQWRFSRGDDPAWAEPDFDDTAWSTVELPVSWEEHDDYTEDYIYGWYRQQVTIPAEWEGRPVRLLVGQIDDADKTFVNGELVGETGGFPDDEAGFSSEWNTVRAYDLAPELIAYGAENTIAVWIYDDLGGGGIHNGPLGMLPLDEDALEED